MSIDVPALTKLSNSVFPLEKYLEGISAVHRLRAKKDGLSFRAVRKLFFECSFCDVGECQQCVRVHRGHHWQDAMPGNFFQHNSIWSGDDSPHQVSL